MAGTGKSLLAKERSEPPPSSSELGAPTAQQLLERALKMTHVPRQNPHTYGGPRDSLDMSNYEYILPPPPPPSVGVLKKSAPLGLGLRRSISGLGASNESDRTARTEASSTCAVHEELRVRRASEQSLTIGQIICEEIELDDHIDQIHDEREGGGDDDGDRSEGRIRIRIQQSIMKFSTLDESLKNSYESSRRKHLKNRDSKTQTTPVVKKIQLSGTSLARMGCRVGSLPNMKRKISSIARLGSTANFGFSSSGDNQESTSAHETPYRGGENADWASPLKADLAANAANSGVRNISSPCNTAELPKALTGNVFLDMLQQEEAKVLDMLKQQQQERQHLAIDRPAATPQCLVLHQPPTGNNASLTNTGNVTAGAGLVFDPKLATIRKVGRANTVPKEIQNIEPLQPTQPTSRRMKNESPIAKQMQNTEPLHSSEPPIFDGIPPARPRRSGRRASFGNISDLQKNVNFAKERQSEPKTKKRISFTGMQKAFNDSISSLLSKGSKSLGDGIDDEDEDDKTVVQWNTLEIREYDTQLGVNPSVSCGPAMALSWSYSVSPRVPIEKYEELRPPRRKLKEMRVPAAERERRLRMSGVSRKEIEASIKSTKKAREKRRKAINHMRRDTLCEKMEGGRRKLLKILGRKKSQGEEEKELWENAQAYFAAT